MDLKEKMMDMMMGSMSAEDRRAMMDSMMDKFFSSMSADEKKDMMKNMMPKMMEQMMGSGNPMMGMMTSMMEGGRSAATENRDSGKDQPDAEPGGFNPMDMCREMMASMRRNSQIAAFATPEIRNLFEEWATQIEDEIEQFISKENASEPETVAAHFKLSKESALYFLSRLAQKSKITIIVK